jgi:hypothetical protein
MHEEFELFKGTSFSDLLKDIYQNSKKKDRQINTLIHELQPLIKNLGDATVIKNDEHLVKLAAVVQRLVGASMKQDGDEFGMSDDEKKRLLESAQEELDIIQKSQYDGNLGGTN